MPASSLPLFYKNAAGQLLLDPAGFLRAYWGAQPRTLADTQALFEHMAKALQRYGWTRILVNQVQMSPFTPAEQQWIAEHWLSAAVQDSGYRFGAVVVASDIFTRLATAFITTNISDLPLRYRSFDDEAAAEAWLRQQA